jgi:hypothetical protein
MIHLGQSNLKGGLVESVEKAPAEGTVDEFLAFLYPP